MNVCPNLIEIVAKARRQAILDTSWNRQTRQTAIWLQCMLSQRQCSYFIQKQLLHLPIPRPRKQPYNTWKTSAMWHPAAKLLSGFSKQCSQSFGTIPCKRLSQICTVQVAQFINNFMCVSCFARCILSLSQRYISQIWVYVVVLLLRATAEE